MTIAPELLEAFTWQQWEAHVLGLLRFYGWRYLHVPPNKPVRTVGKGGKLGKVHKQAIAPGFPDFLAIRRLPGYGAELLVAELKTGTGRLTSAQREWRDDFEALIAGVRASGKIAAATVPVHELPAVAYYVWRPVDLADVEATLAGPAGLNVPVELGGGESDA